jgi:hypothetical protein
VATTAFQLAWKQKSYQSLNSINAKNCRALRVAPLRALTNLQAGLVAVHQDGPIVFYCIQALRDQVSEATSCLVKLCQL